MNRRILAGRIRNKSSSHIGIRGDHQGKQVELWIPPGRNSPRWLDVDEVSIEHHHWIRIRALHLDVKDAPVRLEPGSLYDVLWNLVMGVLAWAMDLQTDES